MAFVDRIWRVALALMLVAVSGAGGQADAGPAHARCRDPHPFPACGGYLLFEYTASQRIAGTTTIRPSENRADLGEYVAWDIGWMQNIRSTQSLGGSLQVGGTGDGLRIALRARHRTWMARRYVLDVSAGPMMAQQDGEFNEGIKETWGATGDVGLGVARIGVASLGVHVARQSGHTASSLHLGGRLESAGVVVVSILGLLGAVAFYGTP